MDLSLSSILDLLSSIYESTNLIILLLVSIIFYASFIFFNEWSRNTSNLSFFVLSSFIFLICSAKLLIF